MQTSARGDWSNANTCRQGEGGGVEKRIIFCGRPLWTTLTGLLLNCTVPMQPNTSCIQLMLPPSERTNQPYIGCGKQTWIVCATQQCVIHYYTVPHIHVQELLSNKNASQVQNLKSYI